MSQSKQEAKRKALAVLSDRAEPLFAVLDAARDEGVLVLLRQGGEEYRSLYEGPEAEELSEVAPYLVSLPRGTKLLEQLLEEGWGEGWGVYLECAQPFVEVRRHLRRFLKVEGAGSRKRLYLRYYDPLVLGALLPACSPEKRAEFFGAVSCYWAEGRDGATQAWRAPAQARGAGAQNPGGTGRLWKLEERVEEAFNRLAQERYQERLKEYLSESRPEQCTALGAQALHALVERGVAQAARYGIDREDDVGRYLELLLDWGQDLDTAQPWAQQILAQAFMVEGRTLTSKLCEEAKGQARATSNSLLREK